MFLTQTCEKKKNKIGIVQMWNSFSLWLEKSLWKIESQDPREMTFWRWKMVWRGEGCTRGDKLLRASALSCSQSWQFWGKTYIPHYQPIIPSCLVKLKRGLNPDLTGVIKLNFFFPPAQRKILDVEHRHLCLLKNCFIIMCTDPVFVCVWCVGFFSF